MKIIFWLLVLLIPFGHHNSQDNISGERIYELYGYVFAINENKNFIEFATDDGNGWIIDYADGYVVGEEVLILFDNMNTDCIYDDEIIMIIKL